MNDFSQHVLDKIVHDKVRPVPRWAVFGHRLMTWGIVLLCGIVSATLCSLLVIAILDIDIDVIRATRLIHAPFVLLRYIPMLWVGLCALFFVLVVMVLRRETHAYRYRLFAVTGMVGVCVMLVVIFLHTMRVSDRTEQLVERHIPPGARGWMMREHTPPLPQNGILVGRVIQIRADRFLVERVPQEIWQVPFPSSWESTTSSIHIQQPIMARGRVRAPGIFEAEWIRVHHPPRRRPL